MLKKCITISGGCGSTYNDICSQIEPEPEPIDCDLINVTNPEIVFITQPPYVRGAVINMIIRDFEDGYTYYIFAGSGQGSVNLGTNGFFQWRTPNTIGFVNLQIQKKHIECNKDSEIIVASAKLLPFDTTFVDHVVQFDYISTGIITSNSQGNGYTFKVVDVSGVIKPFDENLAPFFVVEFNNSGTTLTDSGVTNYEYVTTAQHSNNNTYTKGDTLFTAHFRNPFEEQDIDLGIVTYPYYEKLSEYVMIDTQYRFSVNSVIINPYGVRLLEGNTTYSDRYIEFYTGLIDNINYDYDFNYTVVQEGISYVFTNDDYVSFYIIGQTITEELDVNGNPVTVYGTFEQVSKSQASYYDIPTIANNLTFTTNDLTEALVIVKDALPAIGKVEKITLNVKAGNFDYTNFPERIHYIEESDIKGSVQNYYDGRDIKYLEINCEDTVVSYQVDSVSISSYRKFKISTIHSKPREVVEL